MRTTERRTMSKNRSTKKNQKLESGIPRIEMKQKRKRGKSKMRIKMKATESNKRGGTNTEMLWGGKRR